uniref:G-protein coupled receptors family 1 profile domain-containing protein n=1 Tax=Gouania willdenowi TaxID=441366 RepID=A0A8C5N6W8_GOUWI
ENKYNPNKWRMSHRCSASLIFLLCLQHSYERIINIILLLFSALMLIVVSYNDISVFLSISSRKLHTPTNFLLLSLAVSDFSVGFVWVFIIFLIDGCWFLGADLCVFNAALGFVSTSASVGTVVLISVDRYVAVCDPMHYQTKVTKNRAKICIVLCWVGSTIFHCLRLNNIVEKPGEFDSCTGECTIYIHPVAEIMNVVLSFFIPISIIVVLYVRVFMVAVSQAQAMRSHVTVVTLQSSLKVNRSELKAARALGQVDFCRVQQMIEMTKHTCFICE